MVTWLNLGCKTAEDASQPNPISTQLCFKRSCTKKIIIKGLITYHETFRGDKKPRQSQDKKGRDREIPSIRFWQIPPLETE